MPVDDEKFEKSNDYTLCVSQVLQVEKDSKPTLMRIFNFQSRTLTDLFTRGFTGGFASSMTITRFSDLDSLDEVRLMHEKLRALGGHPPPLPDSGKSFIKSGLRPVP